MNRIQTFSIIGVCVLLFLIGITPLSSVADEVSANLPTVTEVDSTSREIQGKAEDTGQESVFQMSLDELLDAKISVPAALTKLTSAEAPASITVITAEDIKQDLSSEEKAWLKDHPVIRVANEMDWPPFSFVREGKPLGFSVDYLHLIAQNVGLKVEYVFGYTWDELLKMGRNKKIDMLHSIIKTEDRSKNLKFSKSYLESPSVIYMKKGSSKVRSIKDILDKRISVVKGYYHEEIIRKLYPEIELNTVESTLDGLKAVSFGQTDAFIDQEAVANYIITSNMLTNVGLVGPHGLAEYEETALRFAVRNDWPILISLLEKGMAAISEDEKHQLVKKWAILSRKPALQFTDEEKAWLKEHPVIRVGSIDNLKPMQFMNESGEIQGVFMDYLNRISEVLCIQFELDKNTSAIEAVGKLKTRETDMMPGLMKTSQRLEYLRFTEPYLTLPAVIFTRDDQPFVGSIDQLYGKRVATIDGIALSKYLSQNYPLIDVVEIDSAGDGLSGLAFKEFDAYVGSIIGISYAIRETGYTNVKVAGTTPFVYKIGMAVRSDWPEFTSILQKALDTISESERNAIYGRWVSVTYEHGFDYTILWCVLGGGFIVFVFFLWSNARLRSAVRKRTHELVESEGKARALLNSPTDSIFLLDLQGIILDVNETALNMLSVSRERRIGSCLWDHFPQDVAERGKTYIDKVIQKRRIIRFEDERDGIWFDNVVHPIFDKDQNVIQIAVIARDITERKKAEEKLLNNSKLTDAINKIQLQYISEDSNKKEVFGNMLEVLLNLLNSEYGFIGEIFYKDGGIPFLKTHAITNIAWNDETRKLYDENIAKGLEFNNLKSLFGAVITSGKPVISNNPSTDPRRCGIPQGHPSLNAFLGLPFYRGDKLLGMVGVANKPDGYTDSIVEYLKPFLAACSEFIHGYNMEQKRKRAEEALQESENKYRTLFERSADAVLIIEGDNFVDCNSATVKMLGYKNKKDLLNTHPSQLSPPLQPDGQDSFEKSNQMMAVAYDQGSNRFEWDHQRKNGEVFPVEVLLTSIPFKEGNFLHVVWRDITERKLAESEIENYRKHLETLVNERTSELEEVHAELVRKERMAALGELIATVSHEIRNPLGTIRNSVYSIGEAMRLNKTDLFNRALKLAESNIARCNRIINELLDYTRRREIKLEWTEIDSWLNEVLDEQGFPEDVECVRKLHSGVVLRIDHEYMRRVVSNIITNAIQALQEEDSRGNQITVEPVKNGEWLELRFIDTGPGIPDEIREKIFEPLFSTKSFGVGLGVPIIKNIMEEHHGRVEFKSKAGLGTTVILWLPVQKQEVQG